MISSMTTGSPPRSQIRPQVFDQHLRIILCRHTVHPRGNLYSTNVVQSAFPRSVHVAEVVLLALVSNCLHLRLIVWTQSLKIIILVHIVHFLSRRTVIECVSSLAYSNLISCSPAPTSRPSLPALSPPAMSRLCAMIWIPLHSFSTCWSRPHLGNSLPHLRLRQLVCCNSSRCFPSSAV